MWRAIKIRLSGRRKSPRIWRAVRQVVRYFSRYQIRATSSTVERKTHLAIRYLHGNYEFTSQELVVAARYRLPVAGVGAGVAGEGGATPKNGVAPHISHARPMYRATP